MRTPQRWPSNSIHLAQIKENSAAPIWSRSLLLDKRQRAINSKQSPLVFCSIKDCARHQAFPPTEDEENRTRKQRPAFQKCLETYNWHPWNHFFPERRGVSCLLAHDSSWRFLGTDETQPRPKTPKIIHRRCYIYIFMYICWNIWTRSNMNSQRNREQLCSPHAVNHGKRW